MLILVKEMKPLGGVVFNFKNKLRTFELLSFNYFCRYFVVKEYFVDKTATRIYPTLSTLNTYKRPIIDATNGFQ